VLKRRMKSVMECHTVCEISLEWSYKRGRGMQGCKALGEMRNVNVILAGSMDEELEERHYRASCGLDLSGSGEGAEAACFENCNEPSSSR